MVGSVPDYGCFRVLLRGCLREGFQWGVSK